MATSSAGLKLLGTAQQEVLQQLGRVGIAARQAVESLMSGQHRSLHRGLSVEFAGHRTYVPGDDLRHLDWRVFARTDRLEIQLFEEETRMRCTLVVDCSGSMGYANGGRQTKLTTARLAAAALACVMAGQSDAIGLATFDTGVRQHLPPRSNMGQVLHILDQLVEQEPGGETSLEEPLQELAGRIPRRGLVVLFTDCFDDPEKILSGLQMLRHRRQEVILFQIVDPVEIDFGIKGPWELSGLEGEAPLKIDADRLRHLYRKTFAEHSQKLEDGCHQLQVPMHCIATDEPLALALARALGGGDEVRQVRT